jgi:hypothetical protein
VVGDAVAPISASRLVRLANSSSTMGQGKT